ncbi:hypothetical protein Droror1_Dr00010436 [Drosera rotundifolia]
MSTTAGILPEKSTQPKPHPPAQTTLLTGIPTPQRWRLHPVEQDPKRHRDAFTPTRSTQRRHHDNHGPLQHVGELTPESTTLRLDRISKPSSHFTKRDLKRISRNLSSDATVGLHLTKTPTQTHRNPQPQTHQTSPEFPSKTTTVTPQKPKHANLRTPITKLRDTTVQTTANRRDNHPDNLSHETRRTRTHTNTTTPKPAEINQPLRSPETATITNTLQPKPHESRASNHVLSNHHANVARIPVSTKKLGPMVSVRARRRRTGETNAREFDGASGLGRFLGR